MTDELAAAHPDVVIVDASSGDFDAIRFCRDVHDSSGAPIVAVVSAEAPADNALSVELLDASAVGVVRAAVSARLLLAAGRAALRSSPPRPPPPVLTIGNVVIDLDAHVLSIGGKVVDCPPLLFSLLSTLASTPNKVHHQGGPARSGVGRRAGDRRHPPRPRRRQPASPSARRRPPPTPAGDRVAHRLPPHG